MSQPFLTNSATMPLLLSEAAPQRAILLAWPHSATDWSYMLEEVQRCYVSLATAIANTEDVIVVTPEPREVSRQLSHIAAERLKIVQLDTNDTWARDFGPLTIAMPDGSKRALDFMFNAWGMKFAADKDNLVTMALSRGGHLQQPCFNNMDMVLEGGSIDTDGRATILTTSRCLLSPNRNGAWGKARIEDELRQRLGAANIIWLDNGALEGDDTDSHIDTLARFVDYKTIVYCRPDDDDDDPQAQSLRLMKNELTSARNVDGVPYNLVPLPMPKPIFDENGERLPATYANFLILNGQVLVPTYGQPLSDTKAITVLQSLFSDRTVKGIDCRPLIKQHGSLHCVTMQLY